MWFCGKKETDEKTYIFLGHPYDWNDRARIDPRLEKLPFERFNQIWLGGDVCSHTTESPKALIYLDSLFHLSSPKIQWTLGNHDIMDGPASLITAKTGRPSFYSTWIDGFCLVVLNTNLFWPYPNKPPQENCEEKKAQQLLLEHITDTIQKASHLVILHHHALFTELKPAPENDAFNVNALGMQMTCDSGLLVTQWLYPRLVKVQKKGVQVVLIGGDVGMRSKSSAYQTAEGIWLLGSGINNSVNRQYAPDYVTTFDPDKVLIIKRKEKARSLNWVFVPLDSLAGN